MTNLDGEAKDLYERVYCQRGEMENRLKEQQLDLFADCASCPRWWANQYRVLLAALAYTLLQTMRHTALRGTDLARAQCQRDVSATAVQDRRGGHSKYSHRRGPALQRLR